MNPNISKIEEFKRIYKEIVEKSSSLSWEELTQKYKEIIQPISSDIPPADISEFLTEDGVELHGIIFSLFTKEKSAQVFSNLDDYKQIEILKILPPKDIKDILSEMDPDDRVDLFENLPGVITQRLLNLLDKESTDELFSLLGYPLNSVGRFMTPDYIAIRPDWNINKALEHVRKWGNKSETSNVVYVTDVDWKLIGVISLRNLVINEPDIIVRDIMKHPAISILAISDQEEASKTIQKYDLSVLPVVDSSNTLVGIVTADDVFDIVEEETTEDFQKSSAVDSFKENFLHSNILFLFKKRIGWLVMLTFVNLIAGAIILSFENMLEKLVVLVSFMPLLIGSAGNSGSQSATLAIRAIAIGDVKIGDYLKVVGREVFIAFLLGIVMGILAGAIGLLRADLVVAFIVGLTMVVVVLLGSLVGISLPFILSKLKLDPAVASSPLVASIADVFGVLIYLLIAKSFLGL